MQKDMIHQTARAIRHPFQIPLEVHALGTEERDCLPSSEANMGELDFNSPHMINVGEVLMIRIPSVNKETEICGKVIWFAKTGHGYIIGMSFYSESEAFRMRMLEQVCHIEAYRKDALDSEGRELSSEEAAAEWIGCYAASFPGITPVAV